MLRKRPTQRIASTKDEEIIYNEIISCDNELFKSEVRLLSERVNATTSYRVTVHVQTMFMETVVIYLSVDSILLCHSYAKSCKQL